jgi:hypothetical protein
VDNIGLYFNILHGVSHYESIPPHIPSKGTRDEVFRKYNNSIIPYAKVNGIDIMKLYKEKHNNKLDELSLPPTLSKLYQYVPSLIPHIFPIPFIKYYIEMMNQFPDDSLYSILEDNNRDKIFNSFHSYLVKNHLFQPDLKGNKLLEIINEISLTLIDEDIDSINITMDSYTSFSENFSRLTNIQKRMFYILDLKCRRFKEVKDFIKVIHGSYLSTNIGSVLLRDNKEKTFYFNLISVDSVGKNQLKFIFQKGHISNKINVVFNVYFKFKLRFFHTPVKVKDNLFYFPCDDNLIYYLNLYRNTNLTYDISSIDFKVYTNIYNMCFG